MGQLAQRVILIHKLGQLGGTKEFLHGCSNRLDIDQGLRRNILLILGGHTLPDRTLHSGQANPVLVLQQFSHCTDTPVAQMIDIVIISDSILQMNIIINRSNDIFFCNMLGNQLMDIPLYSCFALFQIARFFQYLFQGRIVY